MQAAHNLDPQCKPSPFPELAHTTMMTLYVGNPIASATGIRKSFFESESLRRHSVILSQLATHTSINQLAINITHPLVAGTHFIHFFALQSSVKVQSASPTLQTSQKALKTLFYRAAQFEYIHLMDL